MASYRTEAVVLRAYDLGETDRIVVLFTRAEGKVSAVAKGARKPKGRFVAASQIFVHADYLLHRGRNLDLITQYEIVDSHRHIREDLHRLAYASYAVELVNEMTHGREPAPEVFNALVWALSVIENKENARVALHVFELRLLDLMGYRPQLTECALCGQPVRAKARFSAASGGVICAECDKETVIGQISEGALASLRLLQDADAGSRWQVLRLSGEVGAEVSRVLEDFVVYHVEKRLKSLEFIKSLGD